MIKPSWTEEHLTRALALKQEVYDGKRSPMSCIKVLEVEYPELGSEQASALWAAAWWFAAQHLHPKAKGSK